ncbi:hypothetical protein DNTS_027585 [Danionella cerebrum]|uniref:Uncharacterized protein n=1 Tax=Danionella cerebrum TaxID=2873325 RepID=A0A553QW49_9TELE|nr:hypothetical protein DNTS_027585 [Danionella translucida]
MPARRRRRRTYLIGPRGLAFSNPPRIAFTADLRAPAVDGGFEDGVSSIAQPDVFSEAHEENTSCTNGGEDPQTELAPDSPLNSDVPHREGRQRP